jgi:hypothetical protein
MVAAFLKYRRHGRRKSGLDNRTTTPPSKELKRMTEKEDWGDIDPEQQNLAQMNGTGVTWWAAQDEEKRPVQIENAIKGRVYTCPECDTEMIPVQGTMRAWHFRHKSDSEVDSSGCGGEGARHYRVKTMLLLMLRQVEADAFRYEVTFEPEKRIGQDQPDILVRVGDHQVLGIEIVDTNPPSVDKINRWGDRLHEIHIKKWDNRVIGNALLLSGRLLPQMIAFERFTSQCTAAVRSSQQTLNAIDARHQHELSTKESDHAKKMGDLAEKTEMAYLEAEESSDKRLNYVGLQRKYPALWQGKWRPLDHNLQLPGNQFGVMVDEFAEVGDHVLVMANESKRVTIGVLGPRIEEIRITRAGLATHHLLHSEHSDPFTKMMRDFSEG